MVEAEGQNGPNHLIEIIKATSRQIENKYLDSSFKLSIDPELMTNLFFCQAYIVSQATEARTVFSAFTFLAKCLENVVVDGVEPSPTACLIPIQVSSDDPRLRNDEPNSSPLEPGIIINSLSWPIDAKTGMPRIPAQPDLYPWEIVSHL